MQSTQISQSVIECNLLDFKNMLFERELTVSILVSCSEMSAARNPRMFVGSNLEASVGGLVKPV